MSNFLDSPFYQSIEQLTENLRRDGGIRKCKALPYAEDVTALYLKRQRRAYMCGRENPPRVGGQLNLSRARVLLMGDMQSLLPVLAAKLSGEREEVDVPCPLSRDSLDGDNSVEVLVPYEASHNQRLRTELCQWSDVILLCYDVNRPQTFCSLQQRWVQELAEARQALAHDTEESGCQGRWLGEVPVMLVGLCAESDGRRASDGSPFVSSELAMQFAVDAGASRTVELHVYNDSQIGILQRLCVSLKEEAFDVFSLPMQTQFDTARTVFLQQLLSAPPPLKAEAVYRTDTVDHVERNRISVSIELPTLASPHQYYYYFKEFNEPASLGDFTPIAPQQSYLTAPVGSSPVSCLITGVVQCFYHCILKEIPLPRRYAAPAGYFDPIKQRLVLHQLPEAPFRVRVTRDNQPPEWHDVQGHDGFHEVKVCPVAGELPHAITIQLEPLRGDTLASPVHTFPLPKRLPPPKLRLSPDGVLSIEEDGTKGMAAVYYTLDGTTPTLQSACYRKPITIGTAVPQIRAVAYPLTCLPSEESVAHVPTRGVLTIEPRKGRAVPVEVMPSPRPRAIESTSREVPLQTAPEELHDTVDTPLGNEDYATTRSARLRQAYNVGDYTPPHQPFLLSQQKSARSPGKKETGGARTPRRTVGMVQTPVRSPAVYHTDLSPPSIDVSPRHDDERRGSRSRESGYRHLHQGETNKLEERSLDFDFETPIRLSHLTVTSSSPYPLEYTVYGSGGDSTGAVVVEGVLRPHRTVTDRIAVEDDSTFQHLTCYFRGRQFTIKDLKVHGQHA
ncbi:Chitobiase/beta-hexosaminidase C-terminal domain/Fn3 associated, putative [Angomonas deanei]|uniref:Chitobiase/beta-hexosaminidase C-terminal domain/Fn3 associated, putative n=1 Tax=Angomonas deanei TaxID=59799 RepID=A0A7G2CD75_9TRYP|nr:Chitobiase/beta-hexosaminidase C-terminal domain/Fn3 associated, putative [Angomonas deanei]